MYINNVHDMMHTLFAWQQDRAPTHLSYVPFRQQYVPCSKVPVDETLLGEVLHSTSYLLTECQ